MRKSIFATAVLCLVTIASGGQAAKAQGTGPDHFTGLWAFGDSLTDTGTAFAASGGFEPPSPPFFEGRFSDGPVWIESFGPLVDPNIDFTPFSGNNRAFGGATTGYDGNNGVPVPGIGLLSQVEGFIFEGSSLGNHDVAVIWAGANDYLFLEGAPPELVANAVSNIGTAVFELAFDAGLHHFLVLNLPPLGETPLARFFGAETGLNALSAAHNAALAQAMAALEGELSVFVPEIEILVVDVANGVADILHHPASYGFDVTDEGCLDPFRVDTGICPDDGAGSFDARGVFYWDSVHPSAAAHALVAAFVHASVAAEATLPDVVPNRDALVTTLALGQLRAAGAVAAARP